LGGNTAAKENVMLKPLTKLVLVVVCASLLDGVIFAGDKGVLAFLIESGRFFAVASAFVLVLLIFSILNGRYGGPTPTSDDDSMNYNTDGMPMLGATDVCGDPYGSDSSSHRE
jgi:hypothetical protein